MYVIGIDGGGTKTTGMLVFVDKEQHPATVKVIAKETVAATNPTHVSKKDIFNRLTDLLNSLETQSRGKIKEAMVLFAGMSGVSQFSKDDLHSMEELFKHHTNKGTTITITNDAVTALYSGTFGKPGIVNIAGTGAVTYGINSRNESARVGGWGYLIDHSGCGYGIGLEALKNLFNDYDEKKEFSFLSKLVMERLSIHSPPEALPLLYQSAEFRHHIASLAPEVFKGVNEGDVAAVKIIERACEDMAASVKTLINTLFNEEIKKEIPVVCTGGLFHQKELIFPLLKKALATEYIQLVSPKFPPVVGAVIAGIMLVQGSVSEGTISKIEQLDWEGGVMND